MSLITKSINKRELICYFSLVIFNLFLSSLLLRVGIYFDLFPQSSSRLDVDRVIISNKVKLSKTKNNADILLIGDSSCLMNIDTKKFTDLSAKKTYNLGTLSYLDFESYGALLTNALNNNNSVSLVCLFIHPEFLRRVTPSDTHVQFFRSCNNDTYDNNTNKNNYIHSLLKLNIFENVFYSKTPIPLKNNFSQFYGFTTFLDQYLNDHNGSAIDPRVFDIEMEHGNVLYKITDRKINDLIKLTVLVPNESKFLLCLTPVPSEITGVNYSETIKSIKKQIFEHVKIDNILQMPFTLPATEFATKTHLNATSRALYTDIVYNKMIELDFIEK